MLNTILAALSSSSVATVVTFLWARRKQTADTKAVELENIDMSVKIWREAALELRQRLEKIQATCEQLQEEIHRLRAENRELRRHMEKLGKDIQQIDNNGSSH